jgi:hypothetical protein
MKKEENLMLYILSNGKDEYKHDCKFANSITGHTVYCDNPSSEAPRKCIYRMNETDMCNCALFLKNIDI